MTNKSFEMKTTVEVIVPGDVVIDGCTAEADQYSDFDGDYIEYTGYNPNDESEAYSNWSIYIQATGCEMYVRAMVDDDEIASTTIDIRETDLEDVVEEYADEIRTEIEKLKKKYDKE